MTSIEPKGAKRSLRKRLVSSLKNKKDDKRDETLGQEEPDEGAVERNNRGQDGGSERQTPTRRGEGFVRRMRSLSRSRSRSNQNNGEDGAERPKTIVTVTSCRSDGYYNQKAPGSTSKLPRKAPTNLKLFHELAVGIKDAYAAVGQTPTKPSMEPDEATGQPLLTEKEFYAHSVLWEFIGNIDFVSVYANSTCAMTTNLHISFVSGLTSFILLQLLALVDEVAVDTATRGALKADTTFKGLRDVIKKCNKVLEDMLVRRERRYTLFFRLVQPEDTKDIERIKTWNEKVEKAVGAVTDGQGDGENGHADGTDTESDASSITSGSTSNGSLAGSVFSRGRQLLPVAGRVRARRATPTPTLRRRTKDSDSASDSSAAEDGFAASTPVTSGNLAALQQSFQNNVPNQRSIPQGLAVSDTSSTKSAQLLPGQQMAPKDELVDVIRGLRMEKMKNREGSAVNDLQALKPDWRPKADIPSSVPKLPTEYIHRHRLMKQVVSCLLDQSPNPGPRDTDEEQTDMAAIITSITSRHGDKAGNGKTTLAVAAIQSVEVRERFSDGISWIQLGRGPLGERDIRRLYEELYRQLIVKDDDIDLGHLDDIGEEQKVDEIPSRGSSFEGSDGRNTSLERKQSTKEETNRQRLGNAAISRRRFQGGELEGIKEEIGRMLAKKKVLICLDDVWRVEDAKWFIFDNQILNGAYPKMKKKRENLAREYPSRILMTSRTPSLMGNSGLVQEVFVRILSEHEAVKLLLSTAGRRPYGGKNSMVFNQAKLIVKGCGNSPLAVRLAGSMLRHSSRSWNINSPAWSSLIHQARLNLEEASQLRSFVNAVNRVVDLSFFTVSDVRTRIVLRRCFVAYAIAFRESDWMLSGRGIPQSVVLRVFQTIISADEGNKYISANTILDMLEKLNLIERARHGWHARGAINPIREALIKKQSQRAGTGDMETDSDWDDEDETKVYRVQQMFVMHDSVSSTGAFKSFNRILRADLTLSLSFHISSA